MVFSLRFSNLSAGQTLELKYVASVTVRGSCTITNEEGESRNYPEGFAAEGNVNFPLHTCQIQAVSNCEVDYLMSKHY